MIQGKNGQWDYDPAELDLPKDNLRSTNEWYHYDCLSDETYIAEVMSEGSSHYEGEGAARTEVKTILIRCQACQTRDALTLRTWAPLGLPDLPIP